MNAENIGKIILEFRQKRGLTQSDFAEKIGVSDKTVSRWERGKGYPEIEKFPILAETLEIGLEELLLGYRFPRLDDAVTSEPLKKDCPEYANCGKEEALPINKLKVYPEPKDGTTRSECSAEQGGVEKEELSATENFTRRGDSTGTEGTKRNKDEYKTANEGREKTEKNKKREGYRSKTADGIGLTERQRETIYREIKKEKRARQKKWIALLVIMLLIAVPYCLINWVGLSDVALRLALADEGDVAEEERTYFVGDTYRMSAEIWGHKSKSLDLCYGNVLKIEYAFVPNAGAPDEGVAAVTENGEGLNSIENIMSTHEATVKFLKPGIFKLKGKVKVSCGLRGFTLETETVTVNVLSEAPTNELFSLNLFAVGTPSLRNGLNMTAILRAEQNTSIVCKGGVMNYELFFEKDLSAIRYRYFASAFGDGGEKTLTGSSALYEEPRRFSLMYAEHQTVTVRAWAEFYYEGVLTRVFAEDIKIRI